MRRILLSATAIGMLLGSSMAAQAESPPTYDYYSLSTTDQTTVDNAIVDFQHNNVVTKDQQHQLDTMLKNAAAGSYTGDANHLADAIEAATSPGGVMPPPTKDQKAMVDRILQDYANGKYDLTASQEATLAQLMANQQTVFMQGTATPPNPLPPQYSQNACRDFYPVPPGGNYCVPTFMDTINYMLSQGGGYITTAGNWDQLVKKAVGGEYAPSFQAQKDLWLAQFNQLNRQSPNQMKCFMQNVISVINGERPAETAAAYANGTRPYGYWESGGGDGGSSYWVSGSNPPIFEVNGSVQTANYHNCRGLRDPEIAQNKANAEIKFDETFGTGMTGNTTVNEAEDIYKNGIYGVNLP